MRRSIEVCLTAPDLERLKGRVFREAGGDADMALAHAWSLGAMVGANLTLGRHICRLCGCWELQACEGGCAWAEEDLCTSCVRVA